MGSQQNIPPLTLLDDSPVWTLLDPGSWTVPTWTPSLSWLRTSSPRSPRLSSSWDTWTSTLTAAAPSTAACSARTPCRAVSAATPGPSTTSSTASGNQPSSGPRPAPPWRTVTTRWSPGPRWWPTWVSPPPSTTPARGPCTTTTWTTATGPTTSTTTTGV